VDGSGLNRLTHNPGFDNLLTWLSPVPPIKTQAVDASEVYAVNINPAEFVKGVDNPYFPLIPGTKYVYEGKTEDGLERVEVEILPETREVMGITATVLHDVVYLDGELIEDTYDWFAQDKEGKVWYLGEEVSNYEEGQLKDKAGSWEAGVAGALPGIIMLANPAAHLGETYRQEYYQGEAEDMADLLSVSESVSVPYGSFDNVVKTRDYTPLEPDLQEHKYYARDIGPVKTINLTTGEEIVLVEFSSP
jgi:hypothetical protein